MWSILKCCDMHDYFLKYSFHLQSFIMGHYQTDFLQLQTMISKVAYCYWAGFIEDAWCVVNSLFSSSAYDHLFAHVE
jgi:hypothetical protein